MLASLVLHALVLFALPVLEEAKRSLPAKLTARLVAPKPVEPMPQRAEAPPPRPQPPAIRQVPTRAAPQPVPQPVPPTAPILSAEPAKQAAGPAFTVPATPATPPPAAPAPSAATARIEPQAAVQAASGPDPGTIAQYRLELMDLARRYKKYPRIAQENNWEGRVELRIAIGEDGAIASLSVKRGAGRAVLDDEAQAMIRTAKSKAVIPPALRGKAFVLEIPVDFSLKD